MDSDLRYKGYNNTPLLWTDELFGIKQYAVTNGKVMTIKSQNAHIRLGLLVEQFVFDCLNTNKDINVIATNIQVIEDKRTLGELDCLIIDQKKLRIKIGNFIVAENGKISDSYDEKKLKEYMQWGSIEIEINLKLGNDAFKCYTCDFTHDYIDINADYRN